MASKSLITLHLRALRFTLGANFGYMALGALAATLGASAALLAAMKLAQWAGMFLATVGVGVALYALLVSFVEAPRLLAARLGKWLLQPELDPALRSSVQAALHESLSAGLRAAGPQFHADFLRSLGAFALRLANSRAQAHWAKAPADTEIRLPELSTHTNMYSAKGELAVGGCDSHGNPAVY